MNALKYLQVSKLTHSLLQVSAFIVQGANIVSGVVPPKYQPLVAAVVGLAQAILALANHKDASPVNAQLAQMQSPVSGQSIPPQEKKQ